MTATQHAPQPVTTAAAGGSGLVVVGVDGSPAAHRALLFAIAEAQLRRAVLRIVSSHDLVTLTAGYAGAWAPVPFDDGLRQATATIAADAQALAVRMTANDPLTVEVRVVDGHPSDALLEASQGADLLVVGSRGAGALSRMMMGSTCTEIVHHSHIPVAVIPARERLTPSAGVN